MNFTFSGETYGPNGAFFLTPSTKTKCDEYFGVVPRGATVPDTIKTHRDCAATVMNPGQQNPYIGGWVFGYASKNGDIWGLGPTLGADLSEEGRTVSIPSDLTVEIYAEPVDWCWEFTRFTVTTSNGGWYWTTNNPVVRTGSSTDVSYRARFDRVPYGTHTECN